MNFSHSIKRAEESDGALASGIKDFKKIVNSTEKSNVKAWELRVALWFSADMSCSSVSNGFSRELIFCSQIAYDFSERMRADNCMFGMGAQLFGRPLKDYKL